VKLTRRLQEASLQAMLFTSDGSQSVDEAMPLVQQYNADGAILLAAPMAPAGVRRSIEGRTPVIMFNRYATGTSARAACCDNAAGGYEVAVRRASAAHEVPAFISGLDDASTNVDRLRGFRDGCAAAGLPEPQVISGGDFTYETGYKG